ncbi:conserved Plasmodium protein, unknown function [Plasmodium relictum]|uniref:Uncharacterized protein n=1 Tax=Plasmodium relictum TaxID=85471 RepID=A0A1J1H7P2_PLARL|nr:conserved Plasmodium protein, unknown function [Plasmodium relictum]CRH00984.1 conserved Plasmodium protein, unknown function [Plasmodium relictum]
MKKANLFKDETEKAIVHFIVYFIGILLILCVYYNYIIFKYYFYSLFWAFIISIPLHHVKVKLSEFLKKKIIKKKKYIKSINAKNKSNDELNKNVNEKGDNNKYDENENEDKLLKLINEKNLSKENKNLFKDIKRRDKNNINNENNKENFFLNYVENIQEKDVLLKNKGDSIYKKSFYKLVENIRKELDIYTYIFFLIIKPIYKEEKKDNNNNSFNNYENGNASEIYFLILHRIIFFYILKSVFYKYKEFLLSIFICVFFVFVFYKIIKIIWFLYFYKIFRKYYQKYSFYFSFDFSFIYKRYMNDILTILIIIFAIIIFASISVFFIFNIYGESVFIINSINNYLSVNFKNASIIKNFKKFYRKRGKDDIENLYELVNLTKLPFLSNNTISSIYGHLKRAFDIYENIYSYNFTKNKISINTCCLPLFIERFNILKENSLSNIKRYIHFLNERKNFIFQKYNNCDNEVCLHNDESDAHNFLNVKKLYHNFTKDKSSLNNKSETITENYHETNNANKKLFKTNFDNLGENDQTEKEKYNLYEDSNDIGENNLYNKKMKKKEKKGIYNNDLKKLNNSGSEENNKLMVKLYDPIKEKNFKFKEFINYIYNVFLSLKKIEDIGKLAKVLIFNNSYGLLKIMIFFILVFFNFFMFTFDAIVQAFIFFTALYYLISSKKSVLNYLKDILLVVDPSSIFFHNITKNLKAIIICTLKRIYFYTLYIWLIFSFFQFPIIYVPTLCCIILSLIPVISPEIIILIIILHLWIIKKQKIVSLILFIINFFIYWYFTTTIYKEIPHTHSWLVSLSLFLSISTFGSKGLILGPLIGSIPLILHQIAINKNKSIHLKKKKKKKLNEKEKEKEKRRKKKNKRNQEIKKYSHKRLQNKFNRYPNIIRYSEKKCREFKKERREKIFLWKNKFVNLYKLIEINKNNMSTNKEEDKRKSCISYSDTTLKKRVSPFQKHICEDHMCKDENKIALYIYKRNKEKNKEKKIIHNLISKKIKNKNKKKMPYKKSKSLIYFYDQFQQNLNYFFSCITNNT